MSSFQVGASAQGITQLGTNPIIFKTANAERMRVDSGGNVGIGNAAPAYTLDVTGTQRIINSNPSLILATNDVTQSNAGVFFQNPDGTYPWAIMRSLSNVSGGASNPNFAIRGGSNVTNPAALQEFMTIANNTGYVGIQNSTPKAALHMQGGGTIPFTPVDYGNNALNISSITVGTVPVVPASPMSADGSFYLGGNTSNYLSTTNAGVLTNWAASTYTIEVWVNYPTFTNASSTPSVDVPCLIGRSSPTRTNTDWAFGIHGTGTLGWYYYNGAPIIVVTTARITTNTWNHIAMTYDGTNIRLFINGVLQQFVARTGTPTANEYNAITIGRYNNTSPTVYFNNLRIVSGAVVYSTTSTTVGTTVFSPPLAPLTVHSSGTTQLLLRAEYVNPARMLVSKIGGTTTSQAYPPTAMTANTTTFGTNVTFGKGTYIASSSTVNNATLNAPYMAFDKVNLAGSSFFQTGSAAYNSTTGVYGGTITTTDILGNQYKGDWLRLQLPVSLILTSFVITAEVSNPVRTPCQFVLLGSLDGTNWTVVYNQFTALANFTSGQTQTFTVNSSTAYNIYQIVIQTIGTNSGALTNSTIGELTFYGTQESMNIDVDGRVGLGIVAPRQNLDVIGNTIVSGSVGIANSNPQYNLDVNGTARVTGNVALASLLGPTSPYRIWDLAGAAADTSEAPGYVSASNIFGDVAVSTSNSPFTTVTNTEGSLYLPGIVGSYITLAQAGSPALPMATTMPNFTIETWINVQATPIQTYPYLVGPMSPGAGTNSNYWSFGVNSNMNLGFYGWTSTTSVTLQGTTTSLALNTWTHIACSYTASTKQLQLFVNGTPQTLSVINGTYATVSTTTATFTTPLNTTNVGTGIVNLILGQYSGTAMKCYLSSFRYSLSTLYNASFKPSQYPLEPAPTGNTQVLLRVPLMASTTVQNTLQATVNASVHGLPSDAFFYMDAYGTSLPNLAPAFAPTFDTTITKSVVFTRSASNYVQIPAQTLNIATKGFTAIINATFTGTEGNYERLFDFGLGTGTNTNNIVLARRNTTGDVEFDIFNATTAVNIQSTGYPLGQNQPIALVVRYDPFTSSGTMSIWINGAESFTATSKAASIGTDRVLTSLFIGKSQVTLDSFLNANIGTFAAYNRALSDKEITDAFAVLLSAPSLPKSIPLSVGNCTGKTAMSVLEDGTLQLTGPIAAQNNNYFTAMDYGVNAFSAPGMVVGNVPATALNPFNSDAEGSFYFGGTSGNYIQTSAAPLSTFNWSTVGGFTIEAWVNYVNFTNASSNAIVDRPTLVGRMSSSNSTSDWTFGVNSASNVAFSYFNGSASYAVAMSNSISANTWNHIAMSFDSTNIRLFTNGLLGVTSAINGTGTIVAPMFTIGQFIGVNPTVYVSNMRIVTGAALYTNTFTPPTTPLTMASSGSTVFLLRSVKNPGKLLVSKLGGTTNVQAYPPAGLTANITSLQNVTYGAGTYIVSFSTTASTTTYDGYKVFDSSLSSQWTTAMYSTVSPYNATGTTTTVDANGTSFSGEWIQLQLPVPIVLSSYRIYGHQIANFYNQGPQQWNILASTDGRTWYNIHYQTGIAWSTASPKYYTVSTSAAYSFYRIVVSQTAGSTFGTLTITDLTFYGVQESINIDSDGHVGLGVVNPTQALDIQGNVNVQGNISAGNLGMFRNRIINGDFRIDQRYAGTTYSTPSAGTSETYLVDRFRIYKDAGDSGVMTVKQTAITDLPDFSYALQLGVTTAVATLGTSSLYFIGQAIESFNVADFNLGTPNNLPFTISFWAKSSVTGTFYVRIRFPIIQPSFDNIVLPYTIKVANVWQYVTITVPPITQSALTISNTTFLDCAWSFASGSFWHTTNYNSWTINTSTIPYTGSDQVNFMASTANRFFITGIQLEKGTLATPFETRPYALELALCQRYFEKSFQVATVPASNLGSAHGMGLFGGTTGANGTTMYCNTVMFRVPKRVSTYTVTFYNPASVTGNARVNYVGATAADVTTISVNDGTDLRTEVGFTPVITSTNTNATAWVSLAYTAVCEL